MLVRARASGRNPFAALIESWVTATDAADVNLLDHFERTTQFLQHVEEVGGRALVHCVAGASRSATVILMHLMGHHGIFLRDAYATLRNARPQTLPNDGFKLQLAELEVNGN